MWWFGVQALAADRKTPVVLAVEAATPSVVTVDVETVQRNPFFGFDSVAASAGSGVVIDASGLVVTNAHVVEGARSVTVHGTVPDGAWTASVVALDHEADLAVLRLQGAPALPVARLADSEDLMLGETVIAIGNAMGLGLTVSTGVVSCREREVEIAPGLHQLFIQTDAAINPGNSGGALVNLDGAVIGINTAIRQGAEGIGFAIPANRVKKIAQDLVSYGSVRLPWLGLAVADLDPQSFSGSLSGAVLVKEVFADGPAEKAGLAVGDLVTDVDGKPIASRADLNSRLASRKPGDTVPLGVIRKSSRATLQVATGTVPDGLGAKAITEGLGITVGTSNQVLVALSVTASGGWAEAKLKAQDQILAVDGAPVSTEAQLAEALQRARAQHRATVLITARRGMFTAHIPVEL